MRTWDVIIVGGGIVGLSLALALHKRGAKVLVVERGEPGREASHAAAGMLADCTLETPAALQPLATASARMYPEFVHELQDESSVDVDLRDQGAIVFPPPEHVHERPGFNLNSLLPAPLAALEPGLADTARPAFYLKERSVDPRALVSAALKAAKRREVDISSGTAVTEILCEDGHINGVRTDRTTYAAPVVVNCAGAWAGSLPPHSYPTRPVKGQMLSVVGAPREVLHHVIRSLEVYLIPRSDGRVVIGTTVEEAGYDKRTEPNVIQCLQQAAVRLAPALGQARLHEAWAGLRPGTPDDLPIPGRDGHSRIFHRGWAFPRRHPARPHHRPRHVATGHRRESRVRYLGILAVQIREIAVTDVYVETLLPETLKPYYGYCDRC